MDRQQPRGQTQRTLVFEARQRDAALRAGEPGVAWHEMRAYLVDRLQRAKPPKPRPPAS